MNTETIVVAATPLPQLFQSYIGPGSIAFQCTAGPKIFSKLISKFSIFEKMLIIHLNRCQNMLYSINHS